MQALCIAYGIGLLCLHMFGESESEDSTRVSHEISFHACEHAALYHVSPKV
jgi:hypothetical protein